MEQWVPLERRKLITVLLPNCPHIVVHSDRFERRHIGQRASLFHFIPSGRSAHRIAFYLCYEFTYHILKTLMEDFLRYELLLCRGEETCMFCRHWSAVRKWCQNVTLRCEFMLLDQNSLQIFPDIISDLRSFKTVKRIEIVTILMCMPNFNLGGWKRNETKMVEEH